MRTLLFAVAIAATGCTLDMSEPPVSSKDQDATTRNRLASNRLASNRLASNRLASNRLASNSLSSNRLQALDDTAAILNTISGRDVYSYIVSCALPFETAEGPVTITKTNVYNYCHPDPMNAAIEICGSSPEAWPADDHCTPHSGDPLLADCTYPGGVGLAPEWVDKKLGNTGQGWVSACLFARSNLFDIGVGISMRGRHPSLGVGAGEEEYTLEEGAFYGNVFTGIDRKTGDANPIEWFACRGRGEFETPDEGGLALRDCTESNPGAPGQTMCGFTDAGECADYVDNGLVDAYACRTTDEFGNYTECASEPRKGHFGGLDRYRQVITVYASGAL